MSAAPTPTPTPTTNANANPIRDKTQEIMSILFEKKEVIGDGDYLQCSNLLKEIHDESSSSNPRSISIRVVPSRTELDRELRLRNQVLEERENMMDLVRELLMLTDGAVRRRQTTVSLADLVAAIRNATDPSDDDESDSDSDSETDN